MGAFEPIPYTAKVAVVGHDTTNGKPIISVYHAAIDATTTPTILTNIATVFKNAYQGAFLAWLPDTYHIDEIVVTDLNTSTGPQVTVNVNSTGTAGDGYPNMSGVLEVFTTLRGRSYRGKTYIPIPEGETAPNTGSTTSGWQGALLTFGAALESGLGAVSVGGGAFSQLVIASRKLAQSNIVATLAARVILGFIRRRLDG